MNIVQRFRNLSVQNKIFVTYSAAVIFPLFCLGFLLSDYWKDVIVENTIRHAEDNFKMVGRSLDFMVNSFQDISVNLTLLINEDLKEAESDDWNAVNELKLQNRIEQTFNSIMFSFSSISSGMFVSTNGTVFGKQYISRENSADILETPLIRAIDERRGEMVWFDVHKRNYLNTDPGQYIETMGKMIIHMDTGEPLGYLVLNTSETSIASIYSGFRLGETGRVFILNEQGVVISSLNKEELHTRADPAFLRVLKPGESGGTVVKVDGRDMLVTYASYPKLNWTLVGTVPMDELLRDHRRVTLFIYINGIAAFIVIMLAANRLSRMIAGPVRSLTLQARQMVGGHLNLRFPVNSRDEVGELGRALNFLLSKIRELMEAAVEEQNRKRMYELKLIQSQIKPHFLYNTLELISSMSRLGMTEHVTRTVDALASFYRISLSKGNDIIPIGTEIVHTRSYLEIVKQLYMDVLEYEIEESVDALRDYPIVKMTLQPIVENSVYHGLKKASMKGMIRIGGKLEDGMIVLTVSDNGAGMTEEQAKSILDDWDDKPKQRFGLRSVHDRIQLYFGKPYGLTVTSSPGKGTVVEVRLPATKEANSRD